MRASTFEVVCCCQWSALVLVSHCIGWTHVLCACCDLWFVFTTWNADKRDRNDPTNNNHNNSRHTQNTTHIQMQTINQKPPTTTHVPRAVNKLNFSCAQSTARPGFTRFGGLSKHIRIRPEWPRIHAKRASDNSVQTRPFKVPKKAGCENRVIRPKRHRPGFPRFNNYKTMMYITIHLCGLHSVTCALRVETKFFAVCSRPCTENIYTIQT